MKKSMMTPLVAVAGMLSAAWGQATIINTGFTTNAADGAYSNGDLINNAAWAAVANTGANAFNVIDAEGDGFADTATTDGVDTNTGDYVYLDTTSFGNVTNDQWTGVMDFQLSLSTNSFQDANGDLWRLGLSSVVNTNLENGATNQVYMRIATLNNNGNIIFRAPNLNGGGELILTIDAAFAGWDGTNNVTTDPLRLSWNMRKTRDAIVSGYYSLECSVSNLVSGTNATGAAVTVQKPLLHADASPYVVMGQAESATYNNDTEVVDITIDKLSFTKTAGVPGSLIPTAVTADSGNGFVDLSWDHVVEAENYDVTQIVDGITNVIASGITTNGLADNGLENGKEYIYIVTSHASGVADVDSEPVSGFPDAAVTGTILDTTFAASDTPSYSDGDLAGQNSWRTLEWGPEQDFNVDSSGAGFAETETLEARFDPENGNALYFNKMMSNAVNMAWSGSITFNFDVDPEPGLYVTNIYDVIEGGVTNINGGTNIQNVADLGNVRIFSFGVTDDTAHPFGGFNDGDAAVVVRTEGDGDIEIGLNANGGSDPMTVFLTRADAGWDPEWRDTGPSNAPVFVTQPITLDWTIRKTAVSNMYMMVTDATVGTNSFPGTPLYTDLADPDSLPDNVYASDIAYFAMIHDKQAQYIATTGQIVHVYIDSLSVTHTNVGFVAYAPYGLAAERGNLTIDLTWNGAGDADSFSVWRADSTDPAVGPYTEIASGLTSFAYTDSGLADKRTYFYKVVANYPGSITSGPSEILIVRALGSIDVEELHWGPSGDITGSDIDFTRTPEITVGGVLFTEGNGIDGSLVHSNDYNENVSLYGVIQVDTNSGFANTKIDHRTNEDSIHIEQTDRNSIYYYNALIYMKPSAPLNAVNQNYTIKIANVTGGNDIRAAIRNSGSWYVSEFDFGDGNGDTLPDLGSASWAEIEIATSSLPHLMNDAATNFVPVEGLNNIDAIGYFVHDSTRQHRISEVAVSYGTAEDYYDLWTDSVGLYNENSGRTNDPDSDGLNNVWEWGQGGDPLDTNDQGYTNRYTGVETGATNYFVYVHPRRKDPRPDTYLTETYNLVYVDFTPVTNAIINTMGNWEGDFDFQTVTNRIPTEDPIKIIQLNIE